MPSLMSFSYVPSSVPTHAGASTRRETATDPVCGRKIKPYHAAATVICQGVTYYFCSDTCHQRFTWNTSAFLAPANAALRPDGRR